MPKELEKMIKDLSLAYEVLGIHQDEWENYLTKAFEMGYLSGYDQGFDDGMSVITPASHHHQAKESIQENKRGLVMSKQEAIEIFCQENQLPIDEVNELLKK